MIANVEYRGRIIDQCRLPGETAADGMAVNYTHGIRLAEDRWMLAYDTVFRRGRDIWRGIFYQIREDRPTAGSSPKNGWPAGPRNARSKTAIP
jgi:hypothetical protein